MTMKLICCITESLNRGVKIYTLILRTELSKRVFNTCIHFITSMSLELLVLRNKEFLTSKKSPNKRNRS